MHAPDPKAYDRVVVAFSGGKDSLAALLHLLDLGVSPARIELHHEVDGPADVFMDWPITPAYVAALAGHFAIPLGTLPVIQLPWCLAAGAFGEATGPS